MALISIKHYWNNKNGDVYLCIHVHMRAHKHLSCMHMKRQKGNLTHAKRKESCSMHQPHWDTGHPKLQRSVPYLQPAKVSSTCIAALVPNIQCLILH